MITAIIPTLNEEGRIVSVLRYLKSKKNVSEIIVIDDGSIDETVNLARLEGVKVLLSTLLGKGASMKDGLNQSQNEVVLYLDGDIYNFSENLVDEMTRPILNDEADFVKGNFQRKSGRVTALCAKPLLKIFFPELAHFEQPLGGIVAAKKSFLEKLKFENDYGVDIGLLIDVYNLKARMLEVDIGNLEHDHQDLAALSEMSFQIMNAILMRASGFQILHANSIKESIESERKKHLSPEKILSKLAGSEKIALIDMDGTLVEGSFIESLAKFIGRRNQLDGVLGNYSMDPIERTEKIAAVLEGIRKEVFEKVAREIPLKPLAAETIINLRKLGFKVGVISDSYFIATEILRKRVFADFSVSNMLHFKKGQATGEVTISHLMRINRGCAEHPICKSNFVKHLIRDSEVIPQIISVGNGLNDICLFKASQRSFAVYPEQEAVALAASLKVENLGEIFNSL